MLGGEEERKYKREKEERKKSERKRVKNYYLYSICVIVVLS